MILFYLLFDIAWLCCGKWEFKSWINPVSFYATAWGIAVGLHQSGLLQFHPLSAETWTVILLAQILFSVFAIVGKRYRGSRPMRQLSGSDDVLKRELNQ